MPQNAAHARQIELAAKRAQKQPESAPFLYKGFTVTPLPHDLYSVCTPAGNTFSELCKGKEGVRIAVSAWRAAQPKDRCEHCSSVSCGPLMLREDGYHRVCNWCAALHWPKYWVYRQKMGWYPRTKEELETGELIQSSEGGTPIYSKGV